MEKFIQDFKNQLADDDIELTPDLDYVNADFWDSLTAATIQIMINEEYGLKIDSNKISSFKSLNELFEFIKENK